MTELTSRRAGAFFTRMAGRGAVTAQKAKGVEATLMGKLSGRYSMPMPLAPGLVRVTPNPTPSLALPRTLLCPYPYPCPHS